MKSRTYHEIASILEAAISRAPARAGLRLLPEQVLAERFDVTRMKMRRALDLLFEKGYLSRSRGCGTFLRKVVPFPEKLEVAVDDNVSIFDLDDGLSKRTADESLQKLRLSFWHNFDFLDTNRTILKGMRQAARERGHYFKDMSLVAESGAVLTAEEIRQQLKQEKYDGYLVSHSHAELFNGALDGMQVNRVFVCPGSCRIQYEPTIQMNLFEAVERAIRKLYESGYRRIAMLSVARDYRMPSIYDESVAYELSVKDLKLDYQMNVEAVFDIKSISRAVYDLFNGDKMPPDAIYIADEHFLPTFVQETERRDIVIGRDLGVITQHTFGKKTFGNIEFSRLEFDLIEFGSLAIEALIQSVITAGKKLNNLSLNSSWREGITHLKF